jgi:uncharacterized protein (DUF924 family)
MAKTVRWFRGGPELDREVNERFKDAIEAAARGELDGWAKEATGALAIVILLDQLTRNLYRDDPRMYAADARAQRLAVDTFARGVDADLPYEQALFLAMPLLHAEDLALQQRGGEIAGSLSRRAPPHFAQVAAMHREQCAKYTGVIARFGRFPHRNQLLGRASTPEEEAFLMGWNERAPPRDFPRRGS